MQEKTKSEKEPDSSCSCSTPPSPSSPPLTTTSVESVMHRWKISYLTKEERKSHHWDIPNKKFLSQGSGVAGSKSVRSKFKNIKVTPGFSPSLHGLDKAIWVLTALPEGWRLCSGHVGKVSFLRWSLPTKAFIILCSWAPKLYIHRFLVQSWILLVPQL